MRVTIQKWLQRGRKKNQHSQKMALAEALQKPMGGSELLSVMRSKWPAIQLRDISRLLRQFEERQLIYCLTPKEITGRLYFFTERGRKIVRKNLNISVKPLPRLVNWEKYAQVVRGQTRKAVMLAMEMQWQWKSEKTITAVRKLLIGKHALSLGATIRAMRELEELRLIKRVGVTQKRGRPLYQATLAGKRIIAQLKEGFPNPLSSIFFKASDFDKDNEEEEKQAEKL